MKLTRQQAEAFADNPNVRKLLTAIQAAEGTRRHENPYAIGFGHSAITDLSQHPQRRVGFTDLTGKRGVTTAAGAYQIIAPTWQRAANALGLTDFGPRSQDLAAVYLIAGRGALQDAARGDYRAAVAKLGQEWASLPSSTAAQPKRSEAFMRQWLSDSTPAASAPAAASPSMPATDLPTYPAPFAAPYSQNPFGLPYSTPASRTAVPAASTSPLSLSPLPTMPVYGLPTRLPAISPGAALDDDLAQLRRPYRLSE